LMPKLGDFQIPWVSDGAYGPQRVLKASLTGGVKLCLV
jgi:hypothetical protein